MSTLNMTEAAHILEESLLNAQSKDWSYGQFLHHILGYELRRREEKQQAKRMKWAAFPFIKSLEEFRLEEQQSLSKRHMEQLRELLWLEHLQSHPPRPPWGRQNSSVRRVRIGSVGARPSGQFCRDGHLGPSAKDTGHRTHISDPGKADSSVRSRDY